MSNPSPIKRNKNLVWLSRDHHDGLLIVWKVRQGVRLNIDPVRIKNFVVNAFSADLEPHFEEEESLLFIKLAENDALRLKAEEDHAAIRKKIAALSNNEDASLEGLNEFANLLEAHIRFEERVLFPHLEQEIPIDELEKIGSHLEAHNLEKKPFNWTDEFWKKE